MLKVKERKERKESKESKERYLDPHEFFRGDPEDIGGKNAPERSPGSEQSKVVGWPVSNTRARVIKPIYEPLIRFVCSGSAGRGEIGRFGHKSNKRILLGFHETRFLHSVAYVRSAEHPQLRSAPCLKQRRLLENHASIKRRHEWLPPHH